VAAGASDDTFSPTPGPNPDAGCTAWMVKASLTRLSCLRPQILARIGFSRPADAQPAIKIPQAETNNAAQAALHATAQAALHADVHTHTHNQHGTHQQTWQNQPAPLNPAHGSWQT